MDGANMSEPEFETVIEPPKLSKRIDYSQLWRYRELIYALARRNVKIRYSQAILGIAWAVFQPVTMMLMIVVILGVMAKVPGGNQPYPVFVFAGLLPWMLFSNALTSAAISVTESERLVTKAFFPRLVLPFAAGIATVVDFAFGFVVFGILLLYFQVGVSWSILLVPALVCLTIMAALGPGIFLAAMNVRYRDIRLGLPFITQFWMFGTPSIYMRLAQKRHQDNDVPIPDFVDNLLRLNPMNGLIETFRAAVFGSDIPWLSLAYSLGAIALTFLLATLFFQNKECWFADFL